MQPRNGVTVVEALRDPNLFGGLPAFKDLKTWGAWIVFLKACYGLALTRHELKIFQQHTGRSTYAPPAGGYPEAVAIVGVQSGKSKVAVVLADHAALTGESGTHAILIGQDHRGSMRVLLRYAREPFETLEPFKGEVVRNTSDTIELQNGVCLSAYPCRPEAVRGLRACIVVIDELAFFTATDGRPVDQEMLRVGRGRLATTGGKLIVLSSPYGQSGAVWELHRKHYGREDASTLVWQASAPDMNPTLPTNYLERMAQDDPEAYRSEVLGEFRAGVSTLFDPDALLACVEADVRERSFQPGIDYRATADPASGSGKDSFTLTLVHAEGERVVVDLVQAWRPPFNPSGVISELSDVLKQWGCLTVSGDKYAPGFVQELFRANGITYHFADQSTSDAYLAMVHIVNAQQVQLLDHPDLLRELRGLERRRGTSGRDKVDHRPGAHDDLAASCAAAIVLAAHDARRAPFIFSCGGVRLGGSVPVLSPVPAPPEPARPQGAELLQVPKIALKFLEVEELAERARLQVEAARHDTAFEQKVRRQHCVFPGE